MKKYILILSLFAGFACTEKEADPNLFPTLSTFEKVNLQNSQNNTGEWTLGSKLTIFIARSGMSQGVTTATDKFKAGTNTFDFVMNMEGLRGVDVALEFKKNGERVGYGEIPLEVGTNAGQEVIEISDAPDAILIYVLSLPGTRTITIDSIKSIPK